MAVSYNIIGVRVYSYNTHGSVYNSYSTYIARVYSCTT